MTGTGFKAVGEEANPSLVDAVVWLVPGEKVGEECFAFGQSSGYVVELGGGEGEGLDDVLVDEQCAGRHLSDEVEAIEVSHLLVHKVAVEQAVVVDSGGGEGVADEEDLLCVVFLDEECIVVNRLAWEVVEGECEFFPSHFVGLGHGLDVRDGIGSQAGQAIFIGVLENIDPLARCIDGAVELGEARGDVVGVVVVIVRDKQAVQAGELACFSQLDDLIDYPAAAAIY